MVDQAAPVTSPIPRTRPPVVEVDLNHASTLKVVGPATAALALIRPAERAIAVSFSDARAPARPSVAVWAFRVPSREPLPASSIAVPLASPSRQKKDGESASTAVR